MAGTFNDVGITVLLAVIGVILTAVLVVRNVKGNILWGILATWILGMICQACGLYVPNPANGFYSLFPDFSNGLSIPSLAPIFGKLDFSILKTGEFFVIMFAFLFVDMFDTIGTLIGVSSKANMLDKNGKLPRIKGALMADAVATCAGAVLGTSTTTTFVESASGVSEGGPYRSYRCYHCNPLRLALFLSPIFLAIPSFATAPALIVVGFYMLTNVVNIDFSDLSEGDSVLHLHRSYAVLLQHFRRYCHGSYLLRCNPDPERKSKRKKDQRDHVHPGCSVYLKIPSSVMAF